MNAESEENDENIYDAVQDEIAQSDAERQSSSAVARSEELDSSEGVYGDDEVGEHQPVSNEGKNVKRSSKRSLDRRRSKSVQELPGSSSSSFGKNMNVKKRHKSQQNLGASYDKKKNLDEEFEKSTNSALLKNNNEKTTRDADDPVKLNKKGRKKWNSAGKAAGTVAKMKRLQKEKYAARASKLVTKSPAPSPSFSMSGYNMGEQYAKSASMTLTTHLPGFIGIPKPPTEVRTLGCWRQENSSVSAVPPIRNSEAKILRSSLSGGIDVGEKDERRVFDNQDDVDRAHAIANWTSSLAVFNPLERRAKEDKGDSDGTLPPSANPKPLCKPTSTTGLEKMIQYSERNKYNLKLPEGVPSNALLAKLRKDRGEIGDVARRTSEAPLAAIRRYKRRQSADRVIPGHLKHRRKSEHAGVGRSAFYRKTDRGILKGKRKDGVVGQTGDKNQRKARTKSQVKPNLDTVLSKKPSDNMVAVKARIPIVQQSAGKIPGTKKPWPFEVFSEHRLAGRPGVLEHPQLIDKQIGRSASFEKLLKDRWKSRDGAEPGFGGFKTTVGKFVTPDNAIVLVGKVKMEDGSFKKTVVLGTLKTTQNEDELGSEDSFVTVSSGPPPEQVADLDRGEGGGSQDFDFIRPIQEEEVFAQFTGGEGEMPRNQKRRFKDLARRMSNGFAMKTRAARDTVRGSGAKRIRKMSMAFGGFAKNIRRRIGELYEDAGALDQDEDSAFFSSEDEETDEDAFRRSQGRPMLIGRSRRSTQVGKRKVRRRDILWKVPGEDDTCLAVTKEALDRKMRELRIDIRHSTDINLKKWRIRKDGWVGESGSQLNFEEANERGDFTVENLLRKEETGINQMEEIQKGLKKLAIESRYDLLSKRYRRLVNKRPAAVQRKFVQNALSDDQYDYIPSSSTSRSSKSLKGALTGIVNLGSKFKGAFKSFKREHVYDEVPQQSNGPIRPVDFKSLQEKMNVSEEQSDEEETEVYSEMEGSVTPTQAYLENAYQAEKDEDDDYIYYNYDTFEAPVPSSGPRAQTPAKPRAKLQIGRVRKTRVTEMKKERVKSLNTEVNSKLKKNRGKELRRSYSLETLNSSEKSRIIFQKMNSLLSTTSVRPNSFGISNRYKRPTNFFGSSNSSEYSNADIVQSQPRIPNMIPSKNCLPKPRISRSFPSYSERTIGNKAVEIESNLSKLHRNLNGSFGDSHLSSGSSFLYSKSDVSSKYESTMFKSVKGKRNNRANKDLLHIGTRPSGQSGKLDDPGKTKCLSSSVPRISAGPSERDEFGEEDFKEELEEKEEHEGEFETGKESINDSGEEEFSHPLVDEPLPPPEDSPSLTDVTEEGVSISPGSDFSIQDDAASLDFAEENNLDVFHSALNNRVYDSPPDDLKDSREMPPQFPGSLKRINSDGSIDALNMKKIKNTFTSGRKWKQATTRDKTKEKRSVLSSSSEKVAAAKLATFFTSQTSVGQARQEKTNITSEWGKSQLFQTYPEKVNLRSILGPSQSCSEAKSEIEYDMFGDPVPKKKSFPKKFLRVHPSEFSTTDASAVTTWWGENEKRPGLREESIPSDEWSRCTLVGSQPKEYQSSDEADIVKSRSSRSKIPKASLGLRAAMMYLRGDGLLLNRFVKKGKIKPRTPEVQDRRQATLRITCKERNDTLQVGENVNLCTHPDCMHHQCDDSNSSEEELLFDNAKESKSWPCTRVEPSSPKITMESVRDILYRSERDKDFYDTNVRRRFTQSSQFPGCEDCPCDARRFRPFFPDLFEQNILIPLASRIAILAIIEGKEKYDKIYPAYTQRDIDRLTDRLVYNAILKGVSRYTVQSSLRSTILDIQSEDMLNDLIRETIRDFGKKEMGILLAESAICQGRRRMIINAFLKKEEPSRLVDKSLSTARKFFQSPAKSDEFPVFCPPYKSNKKLPDGVLPVEIPKTSEKVQKMFYQPTMIQNKIKSNKIIDKVFRRVLYPPSEYTTASETSLILPEDLAEEKLNDCVKILVHDMVSSVVVAEELHLDLFNAQYLTNQTNPFFSPTRYHSNLGTTSKKQTSQADPIPLPVEEGVKYTVEKIASAVSVADELKKTWAEVEQDEEGENTFDSIDRNGETDKRDDAIESNDDDTEEASGEHDYDDEGRNVSEQDQLHEEDEKHSQIDEIEAEHSEEDNNDNDEEEGDGEFVNEEENEESFVKGEENERESYENEEDFDEEGELEEEYGKMENPEDEEEFEEEEDSEGEDDEDQSIPRASTRTRKSLTKINRFIPRNKNINGSHNRKALHNNHLIKKFFSKLFDKRKKSKTESRIPICSDEPECSGINVHRPQYISSDSERSFISQNEIGNQVVWQKRRDKVKGAPRPSTGIKKSSSVKSERERKAFGSFPRYLLSKFGNVARELTSRQSKDGKSKMTPKFSCPFPSAGFGLHTSDENEEPEYQLHSTSEDEREFSDKQQSAVRGYCSRQTENDPYGASTQPCESAGNSLTACSKMGRTFDTGQSLNSKTFSAVPNTSTSTFSDSLANVEKWQSIEEMSNRKYNRDKRTHKAGNKRQPASSSCTSDTSLSMNTYRLVGSGKELVIGKGRTTNEMLQKDENCPLSLLPKQHKKSTNSGCLEPGLSATSAFTPGKNPILVTIGNRATPNNVEITTSDSSTAQCSSNAKTGYDSTRLQGNRPSAELIGSKSYLLIPEESKVARYSGGEKKSNREILRESDNLSIAYSDRELDDDAIIENVKKMFVTPSRKIQPINKRDDLCRVGKEVNAYSKSQTHALSNASEEKRTSNEMPGPLQARRSECRERESSFNICSDNTPLPSCKQEESGGQSPEKPEVESQRSTTEIKTAGRVQPRSLGTTYSTKDLVKDLNEEIVKLKKSMKIMTSNKINSSSSEDHQEKYRDQNLNEAASTLGTLRKTVDEFARVVQCATQDCQHLRSSFAECQERPVADSSVIEKLQESIEEISNDIHRHINESSRPNCSKKISSASSKTRCRKSQKRRLDDKLYELITSALERLQTGNKTEVDKSTDVIDHDISALQKHNNNIPKAHENVENDGFINNKHCQIMHTPSTHDNRKYMHSHLSVCERKIRSDGSVGKYSLLPELPEVKGQKQHQSTQTAFGGIRQYSGNKIFHRNRNGHDSSMNLMNLRDKTKEDVFLESSDFTSQTDKSTEDSSAKLRALRKKYGLSDDEYSFHSSDGHSSKKSYDPLVDQPQSPKEKNNKALEGTKDNSSPQNEEVVCPLISAGVRGELKTTVRTFRTPRESRKHQRKRLMESTLAGSGKISNRSRPLATKRRGKRDSLHTLPLFSFKNISDVNLGAEDSDCYASTKRDSSQSSDEPAPRRGIVIVPRVKRQRTAHSENNQPETARLSVPVLKDFFERKEDSDKGGNVLSVKPLSPKQAKFLRRTNSNNPPKSLRTLLPSGQNRRKKEKETHNRTRIFVSRANKDMTHLKKSSSSSEDNSEEETADETSTNKTTNQYSEETYEYGSRPDTGQTESMSHVLDTGTGYSGQTGIVEENVEEANVGEQQAVQTMSNGSYYDGSSIQIADSSPGQQTASKNNYSRPSIQVADSSLDFLTGTPSLFSSAPGKKQRKPKRENPNLYCKRPCYYVRQDQSSSSESREMIWREKDVDFNPDVEKRRAPIKIRAKSVSALRRSSNRQRSARHRKNFRAAPDIHSVVRKCPLTSANSSSDNVICHRKRQHSDQYCVKHSRRKEAQKDFPWDEIAENATKIFHFIAPYLDVGVRILAFIIIISYVVFEEFFQFEGSIPT